MKKVRPASGADAVSPPTQSASRWLAERCQNQSLPVRAREAARSAAPPPRFRGAAVSPLYLDGAADLAGDGLLIRGLGMLAGAIDARQAAGRSNLLMQT